MLSEDVDVQQGRVRLADQQGNSEADTAADLGRRHQSEVLINARRRLLQARSHWYPIMLDLHRFTIALAGVSVNYDGRGGTAPDPLVWDQGTGLRSVGLLLGLMMVKVARLLILLFGIRVAGLRFENCTFELMWILHLFLALLIS